MFFQGQFGSVQTLSNKERPRALKLSEEQLNEAKVMDCPNLNLKCRGPVHMIGRVATQSFYRESPENLGMKAITHAWLMSRICPIKLLTVELQKVADNVPGWSVFYLVLSDKGRQQTSIGYCQMIPEPPTDWNVVHTIMIRTMRMSVLLGQQYTVLTLDEGIYRIAQSIKFRNLAEFRSLVIRLGSFHHVLNFVGIIGKRMRGSGIEDILVESDCYGLSTVDQLMNGKLYNRGCC